MTNYPTKLFAKIKSMTLEEIKQIYKEEQFEIAKNKRGQEANFVSWLKYLKAEDEITGGRRFIDALENRLYNHYAKARDSELKKESGGSGKREAINYFFNKLVELEVISKAPEIDNFVTELENLETNLNPDKKPPEELSKETYDQMCEEARNLFQQFKNGHIQS